MQKAISKNIMYLYYLAIVITIVGTPTPKTLFAIIISVGCTSNNLEVTFVFNL